MRRRGKESSSPYGAPAGGLFPAEKQERLVLYSIFALKMVHFVAFLLTKAATASKSRPVMALPAHFDKE